MTYRKLGITIVELLTVIGVVLILAAIFAPVMIRAKEASKETQSKLQLKQLALSLNLYREQQSIANSQGDSFEMGLPPAPQNDHLTLLNTLQPPNNSHPDVKILGKSYKCNFGDPGTAMGGFWKQLSRAEGEGSVVFIDPYFNPTDVSLISGDRYIRKLIAVRLDTAIVVKHKAGDWTIPTWWITK
ncbi:MAG: type II secretion system protein [Fimbriimonadaceae bacterium]